jgi:prostaglandin reductase 1
MLQKQLKMEGFSVKRWHDRWNEGIKQNLQWIKEVTENFKNTEYYNVDSLNVVI